MRSKKCSAQKSACGENMLLLCSHNSSLFKVPPIVAQLLSDQPDQHLFAAALGVIHDDDEALSKIFPEQLHRSQPVQRHLFFSMSRRPVHQNKIVEHRWIEVLVAV